MVGLVFPGDSRDPTTGSGVPYSLARGFRAAAFNGPHLGSLHTAVARRRVRHAAGVANFIRIGSSYTLPEDARFVTHDDMTVVQAARAGYPGLAALSPSAVAARGRRQRQAFERALACCVTTRYAAVERGDVRDTGADTTRARADLAFAPGTSVSEGLRAEFEWMLEAVRRPTRRPVVQAA